MLAALTGYVADRCGLAEGGRTHGDAIAELRAQETSEDLVARVDRLMALCERARYAPKGGAEVSISEARELVKQLERMHLGPKAGMR